MPQEPEKRRTTPRPGTIPARKFAEIHGVHLNTVIRHINAGKIKGEKIGAAGHGEWYVPAQASLHLQQRPNMKQQMRAMRAEVSALKEANALLATTVEELRQVVLGPSSPPAAMAASPRRRRAPAAAR